MNLSNQYFYMLAVPITFFTGYGIFSSIRDFKIFKETPNKKENKKE